MLSQLQLFKLHGLTIPKLRGCRNDGFVIQMDFVSPPFLLDFAGVLFRKPDFTEDVWQDWHNKIQEAYGSNAYMAYAVYESLSKHGIYYLDFRPTNMKLDGLPG